MIFFVLQKRDQQVAAAIVLFVGRDLHGRVVLLDRRDLEREIALNHALDIAADAQFEWLHGGGAIEEENSLDEHFGVLHLVNGLFLDVFGKLLVAPVLAHLSVKKVLVDCCQFFLQRSIEFFEYFWISLHRAESIPERRCGRKYFCRGLAWIAAG